MEAGKDQLDSFRGTREAPGRQERANWTAWETPRGRKGSIGKPARHQGHRVYPRSIGQFQRHQRGTREAGKDSLASLQGTREAGKDQLDSQGGTREAGKNNLDSLGGQPEAQGGREESWGGLHGRLRSTDWPLEAPGRLVAQDCRSNPGFERALDFV